MYRCIIQIDTVIGLDQTLSLIKKQDGERLIGDKLSEKDIDGQEETYFINSAIQFWQILMNCLCNLKTI